MSFQRTKQTDINHAQYASHIYIAIFLYFYISAQALTPPADEKKIGTFVYYGS